MVSMNFIDAHCHLDFPELIGQIDAVLAAMREARVTHALTVGTNPATYPELNAMINRYPNLYGAVGLHPEEKDLPECSVEALCALAQYPKTVAIGETGLDFYHVPERAAWQKDRFRAHIRAARLVKKPLVIHTRDAAYETLAILREERADEVGGMMHCFTENRAIAEEALALNFYISFSGVVTFKNARDVHEAAKHVPLDRLLIETDSPFLTPAPHRGHFPNTPAHVVHVAEALSRLRDESLDRIARATSENFFRLFKV
ncbi:MAG: TatD family hydrolase [Burkholderiales bacterium]|nr:TatD family hydrolase [Burkholderiales bacterium]